MAIYQSKALTPLQNGIFGDKHRFRTLVCGRRWGKTREDVEECLKFARYNLSKVLGPEFRGNTGHKQNVWYIAPTYRMAKEIAWDFTINRLEELKWRHKTNESNLIVKLLDCGSNISFKGADNPDSLRGRGLNFAVLDEYADIKKEAWTEVIRPALSDKHGHALFSGTPKGFNHFYELYVAGLEGRPGWRSWQYTTIDGGFVPQEEIEQAMADLDERTFRQEYLATFETYAGVIYYNFSRLSASEGGSVVDPFPEIVEPTLHIGMDFNVNPMTAVVCVIIGDVVFVVDEIVIHGSDTHEMCTEIRNRYKDKNIIIYPDPACTQRHTSSAGGATDLAILRAAGFKVLAKRVHPLVRDRINAVNAKLKNAKGVRTLFVSKKCRHVIECMERQTYKEGTSLPDKTQGFDHMNDALGYFIEYKFPVVKPETLVQEV